MSIRELKNKIHDETSQTVARLLMNDRPLHDDLSVQQSNITSGSILRTVKGIQNRKKRRVNQKPGSSQRRRLNAKQELEKLLL